MDGNGFARKTAIPMSFSTGLSTKNGDDILFPSSSVIVGWWIGTTSGIDLAREGRGEREVFLSTPARRHGAFAFR